MRAMQLESYLVSLKPLKLPVATNMARLTGAAMERHRKYVTAISATSPLAFIAAPHKRLTRTCTEWEECNYALPHMPKR